MVLQDLSIEYPGESAFETAARQSTVCASCGKAKDIELLVCWQCFKMEGGLKYSGLALKEWLEWMRKAKNNQ